MIHPEPTENPAALGFRMPAEWEPHAATWLAWPHEKSDWPGKFGVIPWVYTEIIRALARHEEVNLLTNPAEASEKTFEDLLRAGVDTAEGEFHELATDRSWVRDSGQIFAGTYRGARAGLDCHCTHA